MATLALREHESAKPELMDARETFGHGVTAQRLRGRQWPAMRSLVNLPKSLTAHLDGTGHDSPARSYRYSAGLDIVRDRGVADDRHG
jgi:hypothetical protein